MRWFEDYLDLDLSLQDCVSTWQSEDYCPHLPVVLGISKNSISTTPIWDIAANSTDNETVLWWQSVDHGIQVSGTIHFKHIHHNRHTRVSMSLSWMTHLDEKPNFGWI